MSENEVCGSGAQVAFRDGISTKAYVRVTSGAQRSKPIIAPHVFPLKRLMSAGRLRRSSALVQAKQVDEQVASARLFSRTSRRRAHPVRLDSRRGRRHAGVGVGCVVVLAGSRARRRALWGRSRREPSFRPPGRRMTRLGAIGAFSPSCARWCTASRMRVSWCEPDSKMVTCPLRAIVSEK